MINTRDRKITHNAANISSVDQILDFNIINIKKKGKLTKSGTPGWFLSKIGYLFFRDGARLRTPAKRLQIAFWRLNSLRLVYAQHPKPLFRRSNPQNGANDGPQKVLSTDNPIMFRNTPGIPRPVLRFYQLPDFGHTAPVCVHLQHPRRHGNGRHLPATQLWKIPHTTSNLATVMRTQQHC